MNRIDRLFATLLHLQNADIVRADDLAAAFEISKRTVYRDVAALSEMGVPIVSLPGEGYALMEGYFLPPLVFTPEEAGALFLGAELLRRQASGRLPDHTAAALAKIRAGLPRAALAEVEELTELIDFYLPRRSFNLDDPVLRAFQGAIRRRRPVEIVYRSYGDEGTTTRVIEPLGLTYADGVWYVSAYCRLRDGLRSFRLNRIGTFEVLRTTFPVRQLQAEPQQETEVVVRFTTAAIPWVEERLHYAFTHRADDCFHFRVHDLREIRSWLLGWGSQAQVLEPQALRAWLRDEANSLLEMLT